MESALRWCLCVPGMPFVGDTLEREALGGSETAALYLARELSRLGDSVFAFTAAERSGEYDGVNYLPGSSFRTFAMANPHDVCVVERAPELFARPMASKLNILWQHDMTLGRNRQSFASVLWNVDRVALLSQYMIDHYRTIHGLDDSLIFHTRNGVSLDEFEAHLGLPRDPHKLMYTARPERGLDVMLEHILPELLKRDPRYRLHIAGYNNPAHTLQAMYGRIEQLMRAHGDRVVWLGHLTHAQLYEHYASAHLVLYPTPSPQHEVFDEISWITGMEAQASGLPVVTSARGAIPETLAPGTGTLIEVPPGTSADDPAYVRAFLEAVQAYEDSERWAAASQAGIAAARERQTVAGQGYDWAGVARQWHDDAIAQIEARNDCPRRLAIGLIKHGDSVAAVEVDRQHPEAQLGDIVDGVRPMVEDPAYLAAHYDDLKTPDLDAFDWNVQDTRMVQAARWIAQATPASVLDVGSWNGAFCVHLRRELGPDVQYTGVELNNSIVDRAETHLRDDRNTRFIRGQIDDVEGVFDAVFAGEFLEHQPDPVATLSKIEARVKPGGLIVITVPYGPWEKEVYTVEREHLWHFEVHDIADLLAEKPGVEIQSVLAQIDPTTNEPLGWTFIGYRNSAHPVRPVNMVRKLRLQRPRETLAVNIIAGGDRVGETARWCLNSIREIADEIVVADTGLHPHDRALFAEYGAKIIEAPSPLEAGFEVPRNLAIDASSSDWILWLDTDERLLGGAQMLKYLRRNCYAGYSVRQHHFAIDTQFSPDMPVRLFRRAGWQGEPIRFVGMIHEHPELGVNRGPGPVLILPEVHIAHVGYLTEEVRRVRFSRNHPLLERDQERYPDRLLQKHFIMRDNSILINYELQRNGHQVTPEIARLAEENRRLYRDHMLGQKEYLHIDATPYLAQALRVLGKGVDVSFSVAAGRDGQDVPLNGTVATRFESEEDAVLEISQRVRRAMAPYQAEIW